MKRFWIVAVFAGLGALLASCGQQASLSVQLDTSSASVLRGATTTVTVSVGHASGPVTLSVSGLPSGVTATFATPTLTSGQTSTTMEVRVAAAALEGAATLTVHAVEGGDAASATLALTVTSLSVQGTVQGLLSIPVGGAKVSIQGTSATTNAAGAFTIDGVAVPYDLVVQITVGSMQTAHVFQGLTSASPTVVPYAAIAGSMAMHTGTINGTLASAVAPGHVAQVCAAGVSTAVFGCTNLLAGDTGFTLNARWASGSSAAFTVRVLEMQVDGNGIPAGYGRYGTASTSVSDGGSAPVTVAFGTGPSTTTMSVGVNVPAGFTFATATGFASLDAFSGLKVFSASSSPPTSFNAVMPSWPGASFGLVARASTPGGASTLAWQSGVQSGAVTMTLPAPPTQTAPADGASGVGTGSTLALTSTGGGAVTYIVTGGSQLLTITALRSSVTLPDLSSLGFSLASSTSYAWRAFVSSNASSADQAGADWISAYMDAVFASEGGPAPAASSGSLETTELRHFTTP